MPPRPRDMPLHTRNKTPETSPHTHTLTGAGGGTLMTPRAGENPAGRVARVLSTVRGARKGVGARPGYDRGVHPAGSTGVASGLPRWHTQRSGRCQNSRKPHGERRPPTTCAAHESNTSGQKDPVHIPAPSPSGQLATARSTGLNRISPEFHHRARPSYFSYTAPPRHNLTTRYDSAQGSPRLNSSF